MNVGAENNKLQSVFVVNVASRCDDDSFLDSIQGVYASIELARAELKKIYNTFQQDDEKYEDWRAVYNSQNSDRMSVDYFDGKFYICKNFYSIQKQDVKY